MASEIIGPLAGVDYGTRRIGLAISDRAGRVAFPVTTQASAGSLARDVQRLLAWAAERGAVGFVVGLPRNMDGTDSTQTGLTRRFVGQLQAATSLPVETWDERLSSYQADLNLRAAKVRRNRRSALRDALAAQVILQSYLDAHAPPPAPEPPPDPGDPGALGETSEPGETGETPDGE